MYNVNCNITFSEQTANDVYSTGNAALLEILTNLVGSSVLIAMDVHQPNVIMRD